MLQIQIFNIVFVFYVFPINFEACENAKLKLPATWPCEWNNSVIPFVYDFYSFNVRRLIDFVQKGQAFIQKRSCITFEEHNPLDMAHSNYTYIYYSYSGVLESCCLPFYYNPIGRRLVLITPRCTLPSEVAHATLHGLGLEHAKGEGFSKIKTRKLMFQNGSCADFKINMIRFNSNF